MRHVLISGASIAGPALAYWLDQHGFTVTVVERAPGVRPGGYPIDIRGSAIEVCARMGLLPQLRAATIGTQRLTTLRGDGRRTGRVEVRTLLGEAADRDVELPRGELSDLLYGLTRDRVHYVFGDSVRTLTQTATGVEVTFDQGPPQTVDIVVGCDGLHSNTRGLAFGPEEAYHHYLGLGFAGYTVPNPEGLAHEAVLQNEPGLLAAIYAVRRRPTMNALLTFTDPQPPGRWSEQDLRRRVRARFGSMGGRVPWLLEQLDVADDLYFDTVSQIRMPGWTRGRVALVGDAAYAPSFLSGQGTSLALAGAYVLAGELHRAQGDHRAAFPAYEQTMQDFVRRNQALAAGGNVLCPRTRIGLMLRNGALRLGPALRLLTRFGNGAVTSLPVQDY